MAGRGSLHDPCTAGQQAPYAVARPCAHHRTRQRWRLMCDGRMHLGDYCLDCFQWLRWVQQCAETLEHAPPRPVGGR
jgi:hypothetical protein